MRASYPLPPILNQIWQAGDSYIRLLNHFPYLYCICRM
jgi:hypothetical protein